MALTSGSGMAAASSMTSSSACASLAWCCGWMYCRREDGRQQKHGSAWRGAMAGDTAIDRGQDESAGFTEKETNGCKGGRSPHHPSTNLHRLPVVAEHVDAHHRLAKRGVGALHQVVVNVLLQVGRGSGNGGASRTALGALSRGVSRRRGGLCSTVTWPASCFEQETGVKSESGLPPM